MMPETEDIIIKNLINAETKLLALGNAIEEQNKIKQEAIEYLSDLGEIIFFHRGMKGVHQLNNLIQRLK